MGGGVAIATIQSKKEGGRTMETKQVTLKEIPVGGKAKVLKITGSGAVEKHIMDMGVTKGAEVFVRKVAPMGDPVEYTVRGYELSLRKDEAQNVVVEPLA